MAHRTILNKVHEGYFLEEGTLTAAAVTPGMLLERTSGGTFRAHSTAGGPAEGLVAIEDYTQGKAVDDAYSASGRVLMIAPTKGDVLAVRITDDSSGAGGNVSIGDLLESDGAGKFRVWSGPSGDSASEFENEIHPLMVALEAIDMSDSSGVHGFGLIKARVL